MTRNLFGTVIFISSMGIMDILVYLHKLEKARAFDPFGHAGFDPSGKIRMTP